MVAYKTHNVRLEVYDANIVKMSEEAAQRATRRAEHLTERFLSNVRERYPGAIGSMQDPGMQMALFQPRKNTQGLEMPTWSLS